MADRKQVDFSAGLFVSLKTTEKAVDPSGQGENLLDIVALVRSVQLAEGIDDCFRRSQYSCTRADCTWRKYCLENRQIECVVEK